VTLTQNGLDARVDAKGADGQLDSEEVTPSKSGRRDDQVNLVTSTEFFVVHLLPLLAFFTGVTATAVALFFVTFFGRMWAVTAGYHRYFSHRSFRMNRFWGAALAFAGTTAAQKGPLWWAAHHRNHHRYSDQEQDIHSPKKGFWWSHVVWILCDKYNKSDQNLIRDFSKYPEMRFIDKHDWIGPWALAVTCFLIGGWSGLVVGFFLSTVVLWHTTFTINSLAHVWGKRVYETDDTSRNNGFLALLTGGEGWHNNHHRYPFSARQGFRWWQTDTTYYGLKLLSWVGIVKDIRPVPPAIIDEARFAKAHHQAPDTSPSSH
jgi:stearoyl-CoA desaturase (delta-9 desaturase)